MSLVIIILSLLIGIFGNTIYGIFLSHREEGIRRFIANFLKLESNYTASVIVNRPIQQVWTAIVAKQDWILWMGGDFYEGTILPLTTGRLIIVYDSGINYRVKKVSESYYLLMGRNEFKLTPVTSEGKAEITLLTYTLSVKHDNLLEKIGYMFSEGLEQCFSGSGINDVPLIRLEYLQHNLDLILERIEDSSGQFYGHGRSGDTILNLPNQFWGH
jgi:hypothetical protein